jgi:hypothetical protein
MKSKDQVLLEEAYQSIIEKNSSNSSMEQEIEHCEDLIKLLSKGQFVNQSAEVMDKVKNCKKVFSVSQDSKGRYTVIIKDSALEKIEELFPKLAGKFKSASECKKDVEACREEKL